MLLLLAIAACAPSPAPILWVWGDTPDLRDLDPGVGVAVWTGTVHVDGRGLWSEPRSGGVRLREDTPYIAVVRVETSRGAPLDPGALADAILTRVPPRRIDGVQVDWDARLSERSVYADVLVRLAAHLDVPLTVTALVSWCGDGSWLDTLPIDGAVPMYFRMGTPAPPELTSPTCKGRFGVSTDEPWPAHHAADQLWIFTPGAWTSDAVRSLP